MVLYLKHQEWQQVLIVLLNEDFGTYFSSQVYATSNAVAQSDIPIVFAPLGGNVGIGGTPTTDLDVFGNE